MCWSRFSFLKDGNSMIRSTWSALPFTIERTDHHFTICAEQDFPFSKTETWWFEAHDRNCLSPAIELITALRYVLVKIFLCQRLKLEDSEDMIDIAFGQWKNWSPLYDLCWSRLSFLKRRKLNDLKHKIGIAFHQWKNWSPIHDMCWSRFSFAKDGNSMIRKTWSALPTRWFERHDRHCLSPMKELITALRDVLIKIFLSQRRNLDDLKHMIGIAFHQWKKWSPVYDMCWSRLSLLKDGNSMVWSTWSALPFTNDRTDHHFTICADQDFPSSKDGNLMIWSTWSALPFTNDKTDHHFTICADEDFPFSKTETWFEAHDWHCLSPMKELNTT